MLKKATEISQEIRGGWQFTFEMLKGKNALYSVLPIKGAWLCI